MTATALWKFRYLTHAARQPGRANRNKLRKLEAVGQTSCVDLALPTPLRPPASFGEYYEKSFRHRVTATAYTYSDRPADRILRRGTTDDQWGHHTAGVLPCNIPGEDQRWLRRAGIVVCFC